MVHLAFQSILVRLKSPIMRTGKSAFSGAITVSRAVRKDNVLAISQLGGRYMHTNLGTAKASIICATSHSNT